MLVLPEILNSSQLAKFNPVIVGEKAAIIMRNSVLWKVQKATLTLHETTTLNDQMLREDVHM